ncbi:MAG: hypothetical protein HKP43_07195 [Altererythrobacter sp.]|nr:hypothetical protein [Altererythrobacter sp.]
MRKALAFLPVLAVGVVPAAAREVDRAEIAEAFAPNVAPERRVYCADTQMMTLADGAEYRACVNWRAQSRSRLIRTYAALDGPDSDTDANLEVARACFDLAVASQNDPYRTTFDANTFIDGARAHFTLCATNRAMLRTNDYSLRVYERGVWLG